MKKILGIVVLVCVLGLGMGLFIYWQRQDVTIAKYSLSEATVQDYPATKDFFIQAVQDYYGTTIKTTADTTRGYQIYLIQDAAYAEGIGYKLIVAGEDFSIRNIHSSIYFFAETEASMQRAISYFVHNFVNEQGQITLEFGECYVAEKVDSKKKIMIGESPIADYTITYQGKEAKEASKELRYFIHQTGDAYLDIQGQKEVKENTIHLMVNEELEGNDKQIQIADGEITITGKDAESLKDGVRLFANAYLGWMKAGQEDAHISCKTTNIYIPDNLSQQEAWIEEREATIVLWSLNQVRGFQLNGDISIENNILDFSEEQLYEYVRMLKYCGYTGIQVTEMCAAWAGKGGYEVVHEKIQTLAEAAHSMDMKVTLWVWGAEFSGYGWIDKSVTYYEEGYEYAYLSPKAQATFEKYYNIYAELAGYCDRVIAHFYDPGNLSNAEDIAFYSKMLRDKFWAVNSNIDFGINCYVDAIDKNVLVRELGNNITIYESGHHDTEEDYEPFRTYVANSGCRLGTWAWNTCEMELDQLAQMNFNMNVIRSVYQTARKYDSIAKPTYWSEMDCYHVLNVFSLYCAGQMLINPDIESEILYQQISEATVGSEYANAFAEMLSIIQDARSGTDWSTYWWNSPNYVLKSQIYDAKEILARCETYLPVLDEMIEKDLEANTLPLPISLNQLLQLMRPHLLQIRDFAEFRVAFEELKKQQQEGLDADLVAQKLYEIAEPIDSYQTVVGLWGQIEARAQREMVVAFCNNAGIGIPIYPDYDKQRKDYIYAQYIAAQKGNSTPSMMGNTYYQYGVAFPQEETERLIQEMVEEGLLVQTENGEVYLRNWENYSLHFN